MDNKKWLYVYVVFLFVLTFLFASRLITSLKTQIFDYFKLGLNLILVIYLVIKIIKIGDTENNKQ